jgi:hypothetical protein
VITTTLGATFAAANDAGTHSSKLAISKEREHREDAME